MGIIKKWALARYNGRSQMQWVILKVNEWGSPTWCTKQMRKHERISGKVE
jgi:hypothetical protein